MRLGKGTAKHGEVLREDKDFSAIDQAMTCDDSIARKLLFVESEVTRTMLNQLIEFLKRTFVEEKIDALTRSHFAGAMLFLYAGGAPTCFGFLLALAELVQFRKFGGLLLLGSHGLNLK